MTAGIKANVDGSAAIQVGGTDVITLTSGGAATFVTSPTTVQAGTAAAPSITFSGDTDTGIFSPGANTLAFATNGTEDARFDSAGNMGIGTTSPKLNANNGTFVTINSAAASGWLELATGSQTDGFGGAVTFNNTNIVGADKRIAQIGGERAGADNTGVLTFRTTNAGTNSEKMRIDSVGNVGIGTSSPGYPAANRTVLQVNGVSQSLVGLAYGGTNAGYMYADSSNTIIFSEGSRTLSLGTASAGPLVFVTNNLERARITSTGACVFGGTTAVSDVPYNFYSSTQGQIITRNNLQAAGRFWRVGVESGNDVFIIYPDSSGGVYMTRGATSWTGNSDERLKTDLKPIENAAQKIAQLRTVTGRFKTDEENVSRAFLIAQDVQAVLPEAVDTKDDEDGTLGIRYTDTIPLLVAAIKELKAELDATKAKVAALEGA